ncbi:hypothetical protein EYV94_06685 [Puteibacter caeruleilacunae]|nr:hypothetical protein EYV94_06685 [Puteibacter caeruleilacunae]
MRKIITAIILITVLFVGCESDHPLLDARTPLVLTGKVNTIKDNGAIFTATTHNLGSVIPDSYGFIITDSRSVYTFKVIGSIPLNGNEFRLSLETDLEDGVSYAVRAFIQMGEKTVNGPAVDFVSEGCKLPSVNFEDPISIVDGDILELKGNNFSPDTTLIDLSLFNEMGKIPLQITHLESSLIKAKVPNNKIFGSVGLRMKTKLKDIVNENFGTIRAPRVTSLIPTALKVGSYVEIEGEDLIINGVPVEINITEYQGYWEPIIYFDERTNEKYSFYYPQKSRGTFEVRWRDKTIPIPDLSWVGAYEKVRVMTEDKRFSAVVEVDGNTYGIMTDDDQTFFVKVNPEHNSFEELAEVPIQSYNHNLFCLEGMIFCAESTDIAWREKEFWKYDILMNKWIRLADLPMISNTDFFIPVETEGKLYYVVKKSREYYSNKFNVYEFKPNENQWVYLAEKSYPDLVGKFTWAKPSHVVELEGHVYVYRDSPLLLEFDPQTYELNKFTDMPGIRIINKGAFKKDNQLGFIIWNDQVYPSNTTPFILNVESMRWIPLEGLDGTSSLNHIMFSDGQYYIWMHRYDEQTLWKFNP